MLLLNARSVNNKISLLLDVYYRDLAESRKGTDPFRNMSNWVSGMASGTPGQGWRCMIVIQDSIIAFRDLWLLHHKLLAMRLFTKLGLWGKLGLLLLYQPPYCIAISLPELLVSHFWIGNGTWDLANNGYRGCQGCY